MKTIKRLLAIVLIFATLLTLASCYIVSGQKMSRVKGTYKLTHYTYTPSYERKEGYTPKTRNYVEDEEYKYEDYLIITGTGTGYYVHKEVGEDPYVKEITLSYEYDSDDSSKVEYVIYNDALSVNETSGIHKLGITKNNLNYTKNAIDYTELFTKRPMRSEALSVRWQKVDKATDLSYVEEIFGSLKKYDYKSFGVRGVYEMTSTINPESAFEVAVAYKYWFYVIDTAENGLKATAYFASNEAPSEDKSVSVTLKNVSGDWSVIEIDGDTWSIDPQWGSSYQRGDEEISHTLRCISTDISKDNIDYLIESRNPKE